jgi:hypothetical protein
MWFIIDGLHSLLDADVSNSELDFWRRRSLDLGKQRLTPDLQSEWTLTLHKRHFQPWREWPDDYRMKHPLIKFLL